MSLRVRPTTREPFFPAALTAPRAFQHLLRLARYALQSNMSLSRKRQTQQNGRRMQTIAPHHLTAALLTALALAAPPGCAKSDPLKSPAAARLKGLATMYL